LETTTILIWVIFIEDSNTTVPIDAAVYENLRGATKDILDSLTQREAKVYACAFGIEMKYGTIVQFNCADHLNKNRFSHTG